MTGGRNGIARFAFEAEAAVTHSMLRLHHLQFGWRDRSETALQSARANFGSLSSIE
jgi:hypothetical protein